MRRIKLAALAAEVVIITGNATVESAVEAMKTARYDYVTKPFSPDQLKMAVHRAAEHRGCSAKTSSSGRSWRFTKVSRALLAKAGPWSGSSRWRRVAPSEGTVLLIGESGTGKEMFVRPSTA